MPVPKRTANRAHHFGSLLGWHTAQRDRTEQELEERHDRDADNR